MTRTTTLMSALALTLLLTLTSFSSYAAPSPAASSAAAGPADRGAQVQVFDYDLGDSAFQVRGFHAMTAQGGPAERLAPLELTGRVYLPADAAGKRLPLVVVAHGLFWSCADISTGKLSMDWPCQGRLEGIHSDRGYDYLGRDLAARGFAVVSVGANGVNAGEMGEIADRARGLVVFQHLRLWRDLVEHGTGGLAGALTDPETGRAAHPRLRHAIDLTNVGLLGHSRGGRGMMWAAADMHQHLVPQGVRLRAVFGLAAAEPPFMDHATARLEVGKIPLATWGGTCDATGRNEFNLLAQRRGNPTNFGFTVHGANHNFLNSRWAPGPGKPGSEDDAMHPRGRPGKCYTWDPDELYDTLRKGPEQEVARTYIHAFFARYLRQQTRFDAVLDGTRHPVRDLTRVDVRRYRPIR